MAGFDPNAATTTDPNAAFPGSTGNSGGLNAADFVGAREASLPVVLSSGTNAGPYLISAANTTLGGALSLMGTMSPDQLAQLQTDLYNGHWYSNEYYGKTHPPIRSGEPDDATITAYTRALRVAARSHSALDLIIKGGDQSYDITGTGTTGSAQANLNQISPYSISDPADLRMIVDKAAVSTLGRKLSASERDKLVGAITEQQVRRGNEQADLSSKALGGQTAAALGTGTTITSSGTAHDVIVQTAQQLGVDPKLALAIAQQESGMNPMSIGDNGHSVGLFQLNDRGEGAGMSVAQRQDAVTNARIALTQVAAVARQHPDWTPGQIAAAAQRPADQAGYAKSINAMYGGAMPAPSVGAALDVGSPTVTAVPVTQVAPDAEALERIRAANSVEATAHDSTQVYADMLNAIRKVG